MVIEKLVVKTGTACTLRCEKCGEFNPYLAEKGKAYMLDAETLSRDVHKLSKAVEKIEKVHVAGGEALLHKDLFLFLAWLYSIPNIERIELVTNGTVIPDDTTLDLLRNMKSKMIVLISDYSTWGGVDNLPLLETLKQNEINHRLTRDMKWQDRSDVSNKNLGRAALLNIAANCSSYREQPYFTLNDGILSPHCPTAGSLLYYLDLYDECKEDYTNIRTISDEDMPAALEKLNHIEYLHMCNYCIPSWEVKYCQAGRQMESEGREQ